jgi:pentatricopeptide repeat protein
MPQIIRHRQESRKHLMHTSRLNHVTITRRHQQTSALPKPFRELSAQEELLGLVDQYDGGSMMDHLPLLELPSLDQPEPGPHLSISDKPEDCDYPPLRYVWPAHGKEQEVVRSLKKALGDISVNPEESYRLYRALPAPRVPYLDAKTRHKLLRNLGFVERKDEHSMLRYLSVMDDMKATGIPLTIAEWNCATSFAGRYVSRTTEVEVEGALRVWKEMEHVAGIRANAATFNILFDIATKAGKFRLAEMIYEEMARRGHTFNRFHHVSLIYYYGLRADGQGVRKSYKALVEAGEIVDTVVLNCVISALYHSYEPQAAEQVYERMKRLQIQRSGAQLPSKGFRKRRLVAKTLMRMARYVKRDRTKLTRFQNRSIIAPDVHTYQILIQHSAAQGGELHKVVRFLDEMQWLEVPLSGSIFLALFRGFAIHGGIRYTHWTEVRLESVWRAYLQAAEGQREGLFIGKWMIIWALKAFAKCSTETRTLDIWHSIKEKWNPQEDELNAINGLLRSLIRA